MAAVAPLVSWGPAGPLGPRAARALAAVLFWVALLVLGGWALGLATGWLIWSR